VARSTWTEKGLGADWAARRARPCWVRVRAADTAGSVAPHYLARSAAPQTMRPRIPFCAGAAGGAGANTYVVGCEGGGAVRLSVGGQLSLEGSVSANGNPGVQDDSGGGAGGSIWITAGALTGSGNLLAKGGDGDLFGGGGGGGGRIAIYSPANTFSGFMNVAGGSGANDGQIGTLVVSTNLFPTETLAGRVTNLLGQAQAGVSLQISPGVSSTTRMPMATTPSWYRLVGRAACSPSWARTSFVPSLRSYVNFAASLAGENFLMVESTAPSLTPGQGDTNFLVNWIGLPGVIYQAEFRRIWWTGFPSAIRCRAQTG